MDRHDRVWQLSGTKRVARANLINISLLINLVAEFWAMSHVTLHLAGDGSSSNWSQVTPLAEQFEMVQYVKRYTYKITCIVVCLRETSKETSSDDIFIVSSRYPDKDPTRGQHLKEDEPG